MDDDKVKKCVLEYYDQTQLSLLGITIDDVQVHSFATKTSPWYVGTTQHHTQKHDQPYRKSDRLKPGDMHVFVITPRHLNANDSMYLDLRSGKAAEVPCGCGCGLLAKDLEQGIVVYLKFSVKVFEKDLKKELARFKDQVFEGLKVYGFAFKQKGFPEEYLLKD